MRLPLPLTESQIDFFRRLAGEKEGTVTIDNYAFRCLLFTLDQQTAEIAELKRQVRELDAQLASVNAG